MEKVTAHFPSNEVDKPRNVRESFSSNKAEPMPEILVNVTVKSLGREAAKMQSHH